MRIAYDNRADALYIQFKEGKVNRTREVREGLLIDMDGEGRLYGIEILGVSERMDVNNLGRISLELPIGKPASS